MRGWIHAGAAPLATRGWHCAHLSGPWGGTQMGLRRVHGHPLRSCSPTPHHTISATGRRRVTDVLRRIDHVNIFLLIAGTYTPGLRSPSSRFLAQGDHHRHVVACTLIALIIHVVWINAPRWL
ncbi:MAG: hemolysin III family protein [Bifidobacterium pullorum]